MRWLLIAPLLLVACGEAGPPPEGRVYERIYSEAHSETKWEYHWSRGEYVWGAHTVDVPEKFQLDILDEHGEEHRITVPESVWAACSIEQWYSAYHKECI